MRSAYVVHDRVFTEVDRVSMTRQEFALESDINTLMSRFEKSGVPPLGTGIPPRYLDLTDVPDFQAAMQLMIDAEEAFMALPAKVRREFDNDPGKFVAFAEREENLPRMREWGLAAPEEPVEAPERVDPVVVPPKAD